MKRQRKRSANTRRPSKTKEERLPAGWYEERVRRVLRHYENQTEEEAVAEDEAAYRTEGQTMMAVPSELVPEVRRLIASRRNS